MAVPLLMMQTILNGSRAYAAGQPSCAWSEPSSAGYLGNTWTSRSVRSLTWVERLRLWWNFVYPKEHSMDVGR